MKTLKVRKEAGEAATWESKAAKQRILARGFPFVGRWGTKPGHWRAVRGSAITADTAEGVEAGCGASAGRAHALLRFPTHPLAPGGLWLCASFDSYTAPSSKARCSAAAQAARPPPAALEPRSGAAARQALQADRVAAGVGAAQGHERNGHAAPLRLALVPHPRRPVLALVQHKLPRLLRQDVQEALPEMRWGPGQGAGGSAGEVCL